MYLVNVLSSCIVFYCFFNSAIVVVIATVKLFVQAVRVLSVVGPGCMVSERPQQHSG